MKDFILKIPNKTTNLKVIRDFISNIAARAGFNTDTAEEIVLAVDEASTNVIKHAQMIEEGSEIKIVVNYDSEKMYITIIDSGVGFDPDAIKKSDVAEYVKKLKRGGLGIHLMREMMDDVRFDTEHGVCNIVTLVKHLPATDDASH